MVWFQLDIPLWFDSNTYLFYYSSLAIALPMKIRGKTTTLVAEVIQLHLSRTV